MIFASSMKMGWYFEVGTRVMAIVMEVVMVVQIFGGKVGYTLARTEAYSMHKAYKVDIVIGIGGTTVPELGTERNSHQDSLSTLDSKVNYEVAK